MAKKVEYVIRYTVQFICHDGQTRVIIVVCCFFVDTKNHYVTITKRGVHIRQPPINNGKHSVTRKVPSSPGEAWTSCS